MEVKTLKGLFETDIFHSTNEAGMTVGDALRIAEDRIRKEGWARLTQLQLSVKKFKKSELTDKNLDLLCEFMDWTNLFFNLKEDDKNGT